MGAAVRVAGAAADHNARYGLLDPDGAVVLQHLSEAGSAAADWAAVAERFIGVPYLWGGKTSLGLDCSGLVQVALGACGIAAPRDSDMQENAIGDTLAPGAALRRGDLVFWPGHVALMLDREIAIHANAFHMAVVAEPLTHAVQRAKSKGSVVSSIRRIGQGRAG